jgi:hypothetical protein
MDVCACTAAMLNGLVSCMAFATYLVKIISALRRTLHSVATDW